MKIKLLILIIYLPLINNAQSWQWARQIGGAGVDDWVKISHLDSQDNIYIHGQYAKPKGVNIFNNCYIGNDTLTGSDDSFIAKYDSNGNIYWVSNVNCPYGSVGISMINDSVNNYLYIIGTYDQQLSIGGCFLNSGFINSSFIAKLDTSGNCVWAKNIALPSIASTFCSSITFDNNGSLFIVGQTNMNIMIDTCNVSPGTFVAKFDLDGNCLWAETKVHFNSSFQTRMPLYNLKYNSGRLYLSGISYFISPSDTIWVDTLYVTNKSGKGFGLLCLNASTGDAIWFRSDGFPFLSDYFRGNANFVVDQFNNLYFAGYFFNYCYLNQDTLYSNGSASSFLLKYDDYGNLFYYRQFSSTGSFILTTIHLINDNSLLISGAVSGTSFLNNFTISANTPQDLFIAHLDSMGICKGAVSAGLGIGTSVYGTDNSIYLTGTFPPSLPTGTINIGNNSFTSYGWEDIVFAKHDMITGNGGEIRVSGNQLVIYANPNKGSFRIKVPEDFESDRNLVLDIFDVTGKHIKKQNISYDLQNSTTDIFNAAPGTYNVTLSNGKKVYYGRMIVE